MKINKPHDLLKIAVFYDGNYFLHVSNYYNYVHARKRRLSIDGLHNFIKKRLASLESIPANLCQIVDAHYFRGRVNAREASERGNQLYYDRVFDDILMSEGVTTHYLPVRSVHGRKEEKGIDVWLALEAFELAMYKKFDVMVLIASDGDYIPLVRKLNTLGVKVMVIGWDFEYTNERGDHMVTKTSKDLMAELSYPIRMHDVIDAYLPEDEAVINNLFVRQEGVGKAPDLPETEDDNFFRSEVLSLKSGYGFIKYANNNLFFYHEDVVGFDFNDLKPGDPVRFSIEKSEKGDTNIAKNIHLLTNTDATLDEDTETPESVETPENE